MNDIILNQLKDYTLLFVENEKGIRENFSEFFNLLFKKVFISVNGKDALKIYKNKKPDLIITDIKMPIMNGIELVNTIRDENKDVSIVIISAYTDVELLLSSIPLNLIKYIVKPLNEEKLFDIFNTFLIKVKNNNNTNFIFDKYKSQTIVNNDSYELSFKEMIFIDKLKSKDTIITYEEIENDIWEGKAMSQNALRVFIKNVRKKLPNNFIKTITNQGYIRNNEYLT